MSWKQDYLDSGLNTLIFRYLIFLVIMSLLFLIYFGVTYSEGRFKELWGYYEGFCIFTGAAFVLHFGVKFFINFFFLFLIYIARALFGKQGEAFMREFLK